MANRRRQVMALVCGVLCVLWGSNGAQADVGRRIGRARIILTTSVDEAVADGRSDVLVRAECLDAATSRPVSDGTLVLFSTDAGDLSADRIHGQKQVTVETQNGFAEVFISSSEPDTATITATALGDSRDSISVEFVPEGTLSGGQRGVFRVKAAKIPLDPAANRGDEGRRKKPQYGSVNYSMDHNVIEAWHAVVTHRRLEIEAPHLVVSVDGEHVRAWDATLRLKRAQLHGDDVYYSLRKRKGVLWHVTGDGAVERVEFSGATLKSIDDGSFEAPELADSQEWLSETRVWFVCRSALVAPRRKIVLREPTLWVEDKQLTRLPRYHVIRLDGQQSGSVQFNSTGGLSIDYPYYLHASSGEARAVHLQKGSQLDSLIPREGWSLCLSDEYDTSGASGKVWLEGLPESDWSLQWRHHEGRGT
ncbi:MAG: Ig-like domain-containing protein, partial [Armatimonadota bacterium]